MNGSVLSIKILSFVNYKSHPEFINIQLVIGQLSSSELSKKVYHPALAKSGEIESLN